MTRVGQLQTSVRAQQKPYVEVGFERTELAANRWKGQAERPRRCRETSRIHDPYERRHLIEEAHARRLSRGLPNCKEHLRPTPLPNAAGEEHVLRRPTRSRSRP
jgi:hypothetical protein